MDRAFLRRCLANRRIAGSLAILVAVSLAAAIGPWLSPHAHDQLGPLRFAPPGAGHWGGTDLLGRDVMTRVLMGARISLLVGLSGALVSLAIGVTYGAISGYVGGKTDALLMRLVDILYSIPRLVFVIVLISVLDQRVRAALVQLGHPEWAPQAKFILLFIGLGAVQWLSMARIVRGQVLSLKERQFVLAARALGQSHAAILVRHILPNLVGIVIVYLTLTIPVVILEESLLSFLGLGVQPPMASWGTLIAQGAQTINPVKSYWWLLVAPAAAMALTLMALNFLGDGLRDVLDPRARR